MPPFSLDLRDAITVVTGIVTITSVIMTQRAGLKSLKEGQTVLKAGQEEGNRKIDAVHKRLDHYGQEITRIDKDNVRLEERIKALKESQNFRLRSRLAAAEAAAANEPPMFMDEGGE
jgi:predicted nuclease with TOPRIM domain